MLINNKFHSNSVNRECLWSITIFIKLYEFEIIVHSRFLLCEWRFLANNPDRQIVYQFTNISVDCGDTLTAFTNGEYIFLRYAKQLGYSLVGFKRPFPLSYFNVNLTH